MELFYRFDFAAARRLPALPASHPCHRLHGHTFAVELVVGGDVEPVTGWVMDFGDVARLVAAVKAELDHRCLNDIAGLDNPTTERLAQWLWQRLARDLPGLRRIAVQEHPSHGVIYHGPQR